ncbi:MAG TPA: hypothetical protein VHD88_08215 [Pyrinomonadaceae bacterium]|nr:hypothetical protein [Pyrinomonadaceae bacterium]
MKRYLGPVIKPGATHGAMVQTKSGNADDVQGHACGGTKPSDVTSVRRYLRLHQRDINHENL